MKIQFIFFASLLPLVTACNQEVQSGNQQIAEQVTEKATVQATDVVTAQTQTSAQVTQQPKVQQHNEAASTHFVGKPHAPVSMQYEFVNEAALNEELEIKLSFKVERESEMLEVKYKPQDGLALVESIRPYVFSNMPKGAINTVTIRVIPQQTGLRYINVFAAIDVNNIMQSRSFAIPVNIASTGLDQSKSSGADAVNSGLGKGMKYLPEQNVISMPATESTK